MDGPLDRTTRTTVEIEPADGASKRSPANSSNPVDSDDTPSAAVSLDSSAGPADPAQQTEADDEWRRWIAENLMLGEPSERLMDVMRSMGYCDEEALRELRAAEDSPYVKAADRGAQRAQRPRLALGGVSQEQPAAFRFR